MKKPKINKLKIDQIETKRMRASAANQKSIKITININADTLAKIKKFAKDSDVPYQRLINRTLTESIATKTKNDSRLDLLETELAALKRKIAA